MFWDEKSEDQGLPMQSSTTGIIVERSLEHGNDDTSESLQLFYSRRCSRATTYLFSLVEDTGHISEAEGEPVTSRGKCRYQLCHSLSVNTRQFRRETRGTLRLCLQFPSTPQKGSRTNSVPSKSPSLQRSLRPTRRTDFLLEFCQIDQ